MATTITATNRLLVDNERGKNYCIYMQPTIMKLLDEKKGVTERSAYLRFLILKELGLLPEQQKLGKEKLGKS